MGEYSLKVPNGKFLKIEIKLTDDKIKKIRIIGDFFLYPEEGLKKIEERLIGKGEKEVLKEIIKTIRDEKIKILGFSAEDLNNLINRGFEDEIQINN